MIEHRSQPAHAVSQEPSSPLVASTAQSVLVSLAVAGKIDSGLGNGTGEIRSETS